MERLTVKWKPKLYDTFDPIDVADNEYSKINFEKLLTKLGEYEDAEEQGLLIRLPVAEGTTVFGIIRYFFRGRNENQYEICECKFELSMLREIGKTIFLTREEAESALAEKGGAE